MHRGPRWLRAEQSTEPQASVSELLPGDRVLIISRPNPGRLELAGYLAEVQGNTRLGSVAVTMYGQSSVDGRWVNAATDTTYYPLGSSAVREVSEPEAGGSDPGFIPGVIEPGADVRFATLTGPVLGSLMVPNVVRVWYMPGPAHDGQ